MNHRPIDEIKADENRTITEWLELRDHYDRGGDEYSVSNRCAVSDSFVDELLEIFGRDRLEKICNAERDGRLVVLPCKVGDTVWKREKQRCNTCANNLKVIGSALIAGSLSTGRSYDE